MAAHHAGVVIKNALFRLPAKVDDRAVPWVTYTDPELAHVGLTEALAKERGVAVDALRWSFEENDRAQAERETAGSPRRWSTVAAGSTVRPSSASARAS